jgi:hypothetical protein
MSEQTRTQAAEAYLTAVDRLKEKVAKLEAENERLRAEIVTLEAEKGWPGAHRLD